MRVVEQSVEDGVAEGGIADDVVPVLDGDLAGEERAAAGVAVVEDLEEVVSSLTGERSESPVVEDEPRPGEALDDLGIRPVAAGEGEFVKQAGDAVLAASRCRLYIRPGGGARTPGRTFPIRWLR